MNSQKSIFEIVKTTEGVTSIRNNVVNEILHNPLGPWVESNLLYIDQSRLVDRIRCGDPSGAFDDFVIFDIGLGAAINVMATLKAVQAADDKSATHPRRPLKIISFEKDFGLLEFALENAHHFDFMKEFLGPLESLKENKKWMAPGISWELRTGDFLETIDQESERPHLIWFEPYSSEVNHEMWTSNCFQKIKSHSRTPEQGATTLFTYSRATGFRAALIHAGFFVGQGIGLGKKNETTVASIDSLHLQKPLSKEWFDKWNRSHLKYPPGYSSQDILSIQKAIQSYFTHC